MPPPRFPSRSSGRADLILDTTYCSPEYAFPSQKEVRRQGRGGAKRSLGGAGLMGQAWAPTTARQSAPFFKTPQVLRFAIDAVKAEAFNPKTLFLFGSYTIGGWVVGGCCACAPGTCTQAAGRAGGASWLGITPPMRSTQGPPLSPPASALGTCIFSCSSRRARPASQPASQPVRVACRFWRPGVRAAASSAAVAQLPTCPPTPRSPRAPALPPPPGKERLFLEAARVLQRKVYVSVAKRKVGLPGGVVWGWVGWWWGDGGGGVGGGGWGDWRAGIAGG